MTTNVAATAELIETIAIASAEHLRSDDEQAPLLVTDYERQKAQTIIDALDRDGYIIRRCL